MPEHIPASDGCPTMFEMSKVSVVNKKMQWSVLFVMTLTCSEFDLPFVEKYERRRTRRPWMHEGQYRRAVYTRSTL
jgi:hypothetical protein